MASLEVLYFTQSSWSKLEDLHNSRFYTNLTWNTTDFGWNTEGTRPHKILIKTIGSSGNSVFNVKIAWQFFNDQQFHQ